LKEVERWQSVNVPPYRVWGLVGSKLARILPPEVKGIIILLATLMIGAIVFSQLGNQAKDIATTNNDTEATNFVTNAMSTGWDSLRLVEVGAIVLGAVFVLGLLGFLGGGERGPI